MLPLEPFSVMSRPAKYARMRILSRWRRRAHNEAHNAAPAAVATAQHNTTQQTSYHHPHQNATCNWEHRNRPVSQAFLDAHVTASHIIPALFNNSPAPLPPPPPALPSANPLMLVHTAALPHSAEGVAAERSRSVASVAFVALARPQHPKRLAERRRTRHSVSGTSGTTTTTTTTNAFAAAAAAPRHRPRRRGRLLALQHALLARGRQGAVCGFGRGRGSCAGRGKRRRERRTRERRRGSTGARVDVLLVLVALPREEFQPGPRWCLVGGRGALPAAFLGRACEDAGCGRRCGQCTSGNRGRLGCEQVASDGSCLSARFHRTYSHRGEVKAVSGGREFFGVRETTGRWLNSPDAKLMMHVMLEGHTTVQYY